MCGVRYPCLGCDSFLLPLSVVPQFQRVYDVLPKHVTACADRCHRIKIHVGHPDAQCCILLKESLSGVYFFAEASANGTPDAELNETYDEREGGNHDKQRHRRVGMNDVFYRDACGYCE